MAAPKKYKSPLSHLLNPGHSACAGCGMIIAARLVLDAAGPKTIATNATGCSEVTTTQYPYTAFKIPWIHSLFENAAPLASGVLAALKAKGLADKINVLALAGDGATFDIGLGHISGMWARQENILYVCYDNEAYQNTGYQSSGATPLYAATTTAPAGDQALGHPANKKDMVRIALAHDVAYIATASVAYPADLTAKIKKALTIKGPKYLQIQTPCVPGWGIEPNQTVQVAKMAVQSGLYPLVEYQAGKLTAVYKISRQIPVQDFFQTQKRFKHLFSRPEGQAAMRASQRLADQNIKKFKLV